jgi:lysine-specific demethylase 3
MDYLVLCRLRAHKDTLQLTVARALLPTLKEEQEHLRKPEIIRRPRDSDVRATCGMP